MAQEKKEKSPKFTSPRGVFKYPRLNEPDTKFNADGEYSLKLVLSKEAGEAFAEQLQALYDEAVEAGEEKYNGLAVAARKKLDAKGGFNANPLWNPVYDEDEAETGELEFNVKMKAAGTYKTGPKTGQRWTRKPTIYDAAGTVLAKPPSIWGGSEGKVSVETNGYFIPSSGSAGLSLYISAVQLIKLVSGGARDASEEGFGVEDGYTASDDHEEGFGDESGEDASDVSDAAASF